MCAAVALFRCTRPETPLVPPGLQAVRPRIRVLSSLFPIWQLPWETWFRLGVWLLIGLTFLYRREHSLLNPDSPHHERWPPVTR